MWVILINFVLSRVLPTRVIRGHIALTVICSVVHYKRGSVNSYGNTIILLACVKGVPWLSLIISACWTTNIYCFILKLFLLFCASRDIVCRRDRWERISVKIKLYIFVVQPVPEYAVGSVNCQVIDVHIV